MNYFVRLPFGAAVRTWNLVLNIPYKRVERVRFCVSIGLIYIQYITLTYTTVQDSFVIFLFNKLQVDGDISGKSPHTHTCPGNNLPHALFGTQTTNTLSHTQQSNPNFYTKSRCHHHHPLTSLILLLLLTILHLTDEGRILITGRDDDNNTRKKFTTTTSTRKK